MPVINKLLDKITEYLRLKGEKLLLDVIARVSRILAYVMAFMVLGVIIFFLFVFLSLALGSYLNELLNSAYYGYLIVAGIYLLISIVIFLLLQTNKIQQWLEALLIRISENKFDDDDEN